MTTTYNILHLPDMVDIVYQTESGVREIGFDVKPWLEAYGDLKLSIWLTRPGEDVAYPAADVERIGTVLYWRPNGADTAIDGVGRVEVLGLTGEKRKLSGWCNTLVRDTSLAKTQDPPEAAAPWVDSVLGAAERITGMQVATETLEAGSDATAKWDGNAGLLTLGIPSGATGPKGNTGPAGPTGQQGTKGDKGDTGPTGPQGPQGEQGEQGIQGETGPQGPKGEKGDTGATGSQGPKGDTGATGPAGADGVSPTVTASKSGKVTTITIKDASGTKTATINDGADGAKGDPGEPGKPGKDAVVDATLTQSGQAADAKVTGEAVSQLKGDMANKLPKSPSDWAAWTADEQAAARARMGIPGDYELIEEIICDGTASAYTRKVDPNGNAYDYESVYIEIEIQAGNAYPHVFSRAYVGLGNCVLYDGIIASSKNYTSYLCFWCHVEKGFYHGYSIGQNIAEANSGGAYNVRSNAPTPAVYPINKVMVNINTGTFFAGDKIRIYGVRA